MVKNNFPKKNDYNNIQTRCAPDATGFLSDVYKRSARAQKTRALETACSGASKVVSSGRSMIEMLGVLAIIGVLSVGGIAGYSKAMEKFKINKTIQQISQIVTSTRTLYASQGDYTGLSLETLKKANAFPEELTTDWYFYNEFGGFSNIYTAMDDKAFMVSLGQLPKNICQQLASVDWGTESSSGLVAMVVGVGLLSWSGSMWDYHPENNFLTKNCTQGNYSSPSSSSEYGHYACGGNLPLSPVKATEWCQCPEDTRNTNEKGCHVTLVYK